MSAAASAQAGAPNAANLGLAVLVFRPRSAERTSVYAGRMDRPRRRLGDVAALSVTP